MIERERQLRKKDIQQMDSMRQEIRLLKTMVREERDRARGAMIREEGSHNEVLRLRGECGKLEEKMSRACTARVNAEKARWEKENERLRDLIREDRGIADSVRKDRDDLKEVIKGKDQQIFRLISQQDDSPLVSPKSVQGKVELSNSKLRWQDVVLIGVFASTFFSAVMAVL